jgi:hypothetical protein
MFVVFFLCHGSHRNSHDKWPSHGLASHEASAFHKPQEFRKRLLIAPQGIVHQRNHICLAPGNHFAVFATLIAVQYLLYADARRSLGPAGSAPSSTLAKLGVPWWLAVADLVVVRVGLRFGGANVGIIGRVSQSAAPCDWSLLIRT